MSIDKLLVGLTGNICSGKSTVAQYLKELGAYVIDTDKVAHELYEKDISIRDNLIFYLGAEILNKDFKIDREKLGSIVYKDKSAMKRLESLVWPKVSEKVDQLISEEKGIIIIEAPMLYESGMDKKHDKNVLVVVDEETQLQRLMERKNISKEEAFIRVNSQMPQFEKQCKADYFLCNMGSLSSLKNKVKFLYCLLEVNLWLKKYDQEDVHL